MADWSGGTSVVLHHGSNCLACLLSRAMDCRLMHCSIIGSSQSAANSETVVQTCQLSRIRCETHAFRPDLTLSRRGRPISRIGSM